MQSDKLSGIKIARFLLCLLFFAVISMNLLFLALAQDFKEIKGDHFIVHYLSDEQFASDVLRSAESYYKEIAKELGYGRHSEFWTWEKRVNIILFDDKQSFLDATGINSWSEGVADYTEKKITSYVWSKGFLDALLPHEIAHLIFRDYVGFKGEVPLWLDEGVAQWMEPAKRSAVIVAMADILKNSKNIPLDKMMVLDIRQQDDNDLVYAFYVQSASLVGFMINAYESKKFIEFCRQLRDGKNLDSALAFAYSKEMRNINELEEVWKKYVIKGGER
jgi:hypothetical protein